MTKQNSPFGFIIYKRLLTNTFKQKTMKTNFTLTWSIVMFCCLISSCSVVRPGQIAVKQRLGKLVGEPRSEGSIGFNPFTSKVIKASSRSTNLMLELQLPSKEGLSVKASISIIYHLEKNNFKELIQQYGLDYEPIISAIFRSASSDVCAQFFAKDMHSGKRADIELAILQKMKDNLKSSGIVIESVLMKSIALPEGLAKSIEEKLQAEQNAMRMEFILLQEQKEAERKIIEAKGIRDAQLIQAEGLTTEILKLKSIDAFEKLSDSPNSKVIITDGKTPFLIQN